MRRCGRCGSRRRGRAKGDESHCMPRDDEIYSEIVERERHPGRRHTRAELRKIMEVLRKMSRSGDEKGFMQFLRGIGLKDESPRFAELVRMFRALRKSGGR